MTDKKTDCFLVADEVGLGKTKSAKAVLYEWIRLKGSVRCMYLASSVPLAGQNMKEFVGTLTDSFDGLAGFQRKNAECILKKWIEDYTYQKSAAALSLRKLSEDRSFRLSRFEPQQMYPDNGSYIMQLSPITSFSDVSEYKGSVDERAALSADLQAFANGQNSPFYTELCNAVCYEYKTDRQDAAEKCKFLINNLEDPHYFHIARRIRSNASAAMFKPDIIILDEFQRYRNILTQKDGYSVQKMLQYLKFIYKESDPDYCPKLLLLSATPYRFNKTGFAVDWSYAENRDFYEVREKDGNKPYGDMGELEKEIRAVIGDGGFEFKDNMKRTERPAQKRSIVLKDDAELCVGHQKYLRTLMELCIRLNIPPNDVKEIGKQAYYVPCFWKFNSGYTDRFQLDESSQEKLLAKDSEIEKLVYDNLSMRTLTDAVFDGNELPRLWVPPVCAGQAGKGKTLVFNGWKVATRAIAYYVNKKAWSVLDGCAELDGAAECPEFSGMTEFFERPFVRHVISANNSRLGWGCRTYPEAVKRYCEEFRLKEVLDEWIGLDKKINPEAVFGKQADVKLRVLSDSGKIEEKDCGLDYSEMFDDEGETTESDIVERFNSPFYPMVLVARSSAQEGFNLQYYGDKIMHWQFAPTVEAFLQREGRLNRPNSLTMRHKVWRWACHLTSSAQNSAPKTYAEAWDIVMDACKNHDSEIYKCDANKYTNEGLVPMWSLNLPPCDKDRDKIYNIRQLIAVYEYNESLVSFVTGLQEGLCYGGGITQRE